MSLESKIHQIINEVFPDLEMAAIETGEPLDAEMLTDTVGDRLFSENVQEYMNMPFEERRDFVEKIAREYI